MTALYAAAVTLHILAAMLWLGGMGVFALIVVPVARRALKEEDARTMLRAFGGRFADLSWGIFGVLLVTGVINLHVRGLLPLMGTWTFWRSSSFGQCLAAKLALVMLVLTVSLIHARDARRQRPTSRDRSRSATLGRASLVLSLGVVVLAVFLVRGVPW